MSDLIAELGHLFLGTRLKRLAERLQTDAAKVHRTLGVDAQPAEVALLAVLDRLGPSTVSGAVSALGLSQPAVTRTAAGLVARGLIVAESAEEDQRQKRLTLTRAGQALVKKAKTSVWPLIADAVSDACAPLEGSLLEQLTQLELRLAAQPLEARALSRAQPAETRAEPAPKDALTVRDYDDSLADAFYAINAEWISSMFALEPKDHEILSNPRARIVDPGGVILFVESGDLGVVGTCALMKVDDGVFELTKMGVLERARGRRAGELLMAKTLERARDMGVSTLYLLTNRRCVAAIALYEKHGFVHDAAIMKRYGAAYARCDVAMRYDAAEARR